MTFNPLDRNGFIFAVGMLWQKITEKIDSLPVNGNPVGTVISFMGNNAPINYLKCDGTIYNISTYSTLANFFKSEFGSFNYFGGNGSTTFAVPDLRGEFLRGAGTATRNTGSGGNVGAHQDGTQIANFRSYSDTSKGYMYVPYNINYNLGGNKSDKEGGISTNEYSIESSAKTGVSGTKTYYTARPTNTSILYCIKYK